VGGNEPRGQNKELVLLQGQQAKLTEGQQAKQQAVASSNKLG